MRKAKEKNKPLLSLAAAGLAALLLFGMATAVLAQGTQGKFVADEWSGIAEADIAEGDSTKDQAENQASTTPTPTPVSTQDESTALSDATPESAESSELTENKETDSDSNAEIPAEVSAFSNDLAVEEVSLYDASGTSAQDAVTSWTELKSAVASAANGATIYLSGEITIPLDEVLSVSKNLRLYADQKYYEHCFACAVAALGGVDRRLGRHIVLHVCVSLSASTHRRLPRQNAARLSARFRLLPVRDAVFIGTYARPGCFRVYRGIFLPVNRTVRPCQSPGTAPERERTESTSAAHLHSAADCGRPYGSSFIFPPRLGCLYSVRCFCGCVITCNLVARLWSV